jgi:periplasmic divalent cation tolerance protein
MVCLIITTCKEKDEKAIVESLLQNRFAACINSLTVNSKFFWKGTIKCENEKLLLIKTTIKHYNAIENIIKKHNSYELPEILCISIEKGLIDYIDWIKKIVE